MTPTNNGTHCTLREGMSDSLLFVWLEDGVGSSVWASMDSENGRIPDNLACSFRRILDGIQISDSKNESDMNSAVRPISVP